MYRAIAELVMVAHFAFLVVLTLGGFAAWRWPRFIWAHVGLAIWGVLNAVVKVPCPLTEVEDWARRRAGEQGLPSGFIDRYLTGVVYPAEHLVAVQSAVAGAVVVSWIGFVVLWHRRRRDAVSGHVRPRARSTRSESAR
ncbi:MAG: DUF2784 domain-containing protein [Geodermatophilaceae bacterium]